MKNKLNKLVTKWRALEGEALENESAYAHVYGYCADELEELLKTSPGLIESLQEDVEKLKEDQLQLRRILESLIKPSF